MSHPDLCVRCSDRDYTDCTWKSVSKKNVGIFQIETFLNNNNDSLWEYYRAGNIETADLPETEQFSSSREVFVRFWMSSKYDQIELLFDDSHTSGSLPFELLGFLMPIVFLKHDVITLHGVLMEYMGRGFIFSAPSGIGKSTHARLWRDRKQALILNGDRASCCLEDDRWIGFSLPWSGTSGEQINRSVPLSAFITLSQSEENRVERLEDLDAFEAVMPSLLYPHWNRELTEKALDFIDDFLQRIPVYHLYCRPDAEAVEVLEQALREI